MHTSIRSLACLALVISAPAFAQGPDMSQVEIKATLLAPGLHMLTGRGGNLGVSSGPAGVFLVDDQYAPLTDKIKAAIAAIDPRPIRFVLNTHWHGDHTGGNENLGKAGVLIVAHDNVRVRIAALVAQGKSADEVVAAKPLADLDATWGGGFFKTDDFVRLVFEGMKGAKP